MAQRTVIHLEDDIDGSEASETVELTYQGIQYQLDLSDKNLAKLQKALDPYLSAARRVGGRKRSSSSGNGAAHTDREQLQAAREWLRGQGYEVSDRGRVKAELMELYNNAH